MVKPPGITRFSAWKEGNSLPPKMASTAAGNKNAFDDSDPLLIPDNADHSILQQPLNVGIKNVKQILKCIQSGSREVKDIILNECNIIYECKVCQSLFRSLANLLFHKRGFCKEHICENMVLFEPCKEVEEEDVAETSKNKNPEDDNQVLNAESTDPEKEENSEKLIVEMEKNATMESDKTISVDNEDTEMIDVEEEEQSKKQNDDILDSSTDKSEEKLVINIDEPASVASSSHEVENEASMNESPSSPEKPKPKPIFKLKISPSGVSPKQKNIFPIILKPISGNQNAVLQVVKKATTESPTVNPNKEQKTANSVEASNSPEEKKKVIIVLPNNPSPRISSNDNLDNDKSPDFHLTRRKRLLNRTDCCVNTLKCLKCNTHFTTLKTLFFHMMSVHSKKRMYYPCPFCKALFVQMYGVTRHLIQIHGKTKDDINNKIRDTIRKSIVWKRIDPSLKEEEGTEVSEKENNRKSKDSADADDKESTSIKVKDAHNFDSKLLHSYVKVENNVNVHHCSKCGRVFSRKSSQVSHEKFCIMNSPTKSDSSESSFHSRHMSESPPKIIAPVSIVIAEKPNPFEIRLSARPKRGAEKQMHKDFVDSQTLKWRSANKIDTPKLTTTPVVVNKPIAKTHDKKIMSLVDAEKLLCLKCNKKFSSFSNLRRHAAIHIGWTRYKCKCCDYQSYNKSDCIHHIERMHSTVDLEEIEQCVVPLASEIALGKEFSSLKIQKSSKNSDMNVKRTHLEKKKKHFMKKQEADHKRILGSSFKRKQIDKKIVLPTKRSLPDSPREKHVKVRSPTKSSIKKTPSNYRSVTTNSPTTIILSKTCSNTTVQITKNVAPISTKNIDDPSEKLTPTRISPRKMEPSIKLSKNSFVTLSNERKTNVIKIKVPPRDSTGEKSPHSSPERNIQSKNRQLNEWLVKRDESGESSRRDPVIIDLFPASSSSVTRPKTFSINK